MNQSRVCINSVDNGLMSGEVQNPFMPEALPFADLAELLNRLEIVMDTLDFPQSYHRHRTFRAAAAQEKPKEISAVRYMEEEVFEKVTGQKATFIVQVQFRQNATWQGTITWLEEKRKQQFRSTLEMIKLMNDAVAESEQEKEQMATW